MYYLDNGNIVSKIEDLRGEISDDLYQAVEGMHQEELGKSLCNLSITTYERDLAEGRLETCHMEMQEAYRTLDDLGTYIMTTKRLSRNELLDRIRAITKNIENSIDA